MNTLGIIYKITNTKTSKVYIGQTQKSLEERFTRHKELAKRKVNRYLYDAINHYGEDNFIIEKIDEANTKVDLDEKEKYWISFYSSDNPEKGYNMTIGGGGGDTWSLQSEERKIERIERFKKKMCGRKVSIETIEKIRSKTKGKKRNLEQCKKMGKHRRLKGEDNPMYNKNFLDMMTPEAIKARNEKISKNHRNPIKHIDTRTNTLFNSRKSILTSLNITPLELKILITEGIIHEL